MEHTEMKILPGAVADNQDGKGKVAAYNKTRLLSKLAFFFVCFFFINVGVKC